MIEQVIQKLDLRQIYLGIGSIIFLALTALVMLVGKPLYERHSAANEELAALGEIVESGARPSLAPLQEEVENYRRKILGELENVPVRQLESHIIGALQNSAWQSQVDLVSIEPQATIEDMPYQEIAFRLELEGSYFNLDEWLNVVSSQLGYVVFKEYSVRTEIAGKDPHLNARVLLAAYRVNDKP